MAIADLRKEAEQESQNCFPKKIEWHCKEVQKGRLPSLSWHNIFWLYSREGERLESKRGMNSYQSWVPA